MKVAITGCTGNVGRCVVALALEQGHAVIGIDRTAPVEELGQHFAFVQADLREYNAALDALRGCDAVVQLAAFPNAGDYGVQASRSQTAAHCVKITTCTRYITSERSALSASEDIPTRAITCAGTS